MSKFVMVRAEVFEVMRHNAGLAVGLADENKRLAQELSQIKDTCKQCGANVDGWAERYTYEIERLNKELCRAHASAEHRKEQLKHVKNVAEAYLAK